MQFGVTYGQFLQIRYRFVEPSPMETSCTSSKNALTSRVLSSRRVAEDAEVEVTTMSSRMPSSSTVSTVPLGRFEPN